MSRSALSSCSLVNSKEGREPLPLPCPFFWPVSLASVFFGAAMAIPDERTNSPLYPNSNRHERIACRGENFAMPQCNAARHFRNCFHRFLKLPDDPDQVSSDWTSNRERHFTSRISPDNHFRTVK